MQIVPHLCKRVLKRLLQMGYLIATLCDRMQIVPHLCKRVLKRLLQLRYLIAEPCGFLLGVRSLLPTEMGCDSRVSDVQQTPGPACQSTQERQAAKDVHEGSQVIIPQSRWQMAEASGKAAAACVDTRFRRRW